ncbi:MAG: F0F1 ATP synthase subunit delta [Pseudomonadales bacterium]
MAELATLARPYANAVFDMARQSGDLDRWSRTLGFLAAAAAHPQMQSYLEAPGLPEEAKATRLSDVCGDEIQPSAVKFLQVLAHNKRLSLLAEIREQFESLRAQEQQTLDVEVTSAFELSAAESDKLKAALHTRFKREVSMTSKVDASLLGGAVIRAGDTVIDGSVRGKLRKLAESIQRT